MTTPKAPKIAREGTSREGKSLYNLNLRVTGAQMQRLRGRFAHRMDKLVTWQEWLRESLLFGADL